MIIVKPFVSLIDMTEDPLGLIERAGRVCYRSEHKTTKTSKYMFIRKLIDRGHLSPLEFASATFEITCDRAIANELVRHRLASYCQESTRYVTYDSDMPVICPPDMTEEQYHAWVGAMIATEKTYKDLLFKGSPPQIARAVLPLCLATTIIMKANFREWRHIINLRTAAAAHPQMIEIMNMIEALIISSDAVDLLMP